MVKARKKMLKELGMMAEDKHTLMKMVKIGKEVIQVMMKIAMMMMVVVVNV